MHNLPTPSRSPPSDKKQHEALARKTARMLTCDPMYPGEIGAFALGGLIFLRHGAEGKVFAELFPSEAEKIIKEAARRLQEVIRQCE